ncbi:hypothetical protein Leryth_008231 [Lithospermum erythrorhizon]|uniref:Late embryogenesis abundant protein LEA-2 subgroup domain-containing protein n=1 Tax=Lithospermum erythrorhizon TaxID=34254 RepID=A0AAV3QPZ9_LITER|nr:hypothetical protein Leryth_008231 [Lithospermum erythrorhizon]
MSMHAKTDSSDGTSLAPSSPNRPVYFVQSPSRDSHDGEKTTNSFHSTPILSPMGSPGRHSRDSSSTRYSGSLKPGSQKSTTSNGSRSGRHHNARKGEKQWKEFDAIEEEGLLDDEYGHKGMPRRCYVLAFVVGFFVLFTLFSLILWGASRSQKPVVTMRSITYNEFVIQSGSDFSGVATDMISMNSTIKLLFRNKGTFFGVHVTSSPVDLSFSELVFASGSIKKFYQSRNSQRIVTIPLKGKYIPLYGGGASLSSKDGKLTAPVGLTLSFTIRVRAYVLGKLVKTKFYKRIQCQVLLDPKKMNKALSLKNLCTFN